LILNTSRGLDVDLLLSARSASGVIDRSVLRDDDTERPGDEWLSQDVDVLVPAAVSYSITADNCDRIRGKFVVEAANVPTTPEAEQLLLDRGIMVIPDFIANTGAAAGAWWVILGEVVSPAGACSRLSAQIRPLVRDLMSRADETGMSVRAAGVRFARENSQRMIREYGGAVAFRDLFPDTSEGAQFADGDMEPAVESLGSSVADEAVIHPPNGAFPVSTGLVDASLETGRQPAGACPAYYPGPADAATGQA
ncbi:MAG TPA: hypothetical protein VGO89_07440, partial [Streptomyces sp.]|nr:hypothetical protein [Streptomyces sp.]